MAKSVMTTDPDRIATLTAQNEKLRRALEAMLHLAPTEEGYCGYCKERVGNLLPVNDARHSSTCPVPKARAALSLPAPEPGSVGRLVSIVRKCLKARVSVDDGYPAACLIFAYPSEVEEAVAAARAVREPEGG